MKIVGVIPARMGSSRFPGKPLALIRGKTMIEHVYKRSALCQALDAVVVATPDPEIAQAVRNFAGEFIMTSPDHQRATDRVAEAARTVGGDIVIVIQGDEPLVHPDMIEAAVKPVAEDDSIFCSNLVERIGSRAEFENPNTIKVTMDYQGNALYFSREPIPNQTNIGFDKIQAYRQVCIIPFRIANLFKFLELEPTPLEETESIDMLRILENGYKVRMVETEFRTLSVDLAAEILPVEQAMEHDPLCSLY
jgi:3-deoxy-manno-octulosonate cytidylyltransferase (CMP-KDO synthetase)